MASSVPAQAIEAKLIAENPTTYPVYLWEDDIGDPSQITSPFIMLEFPGGSSKQASTGAPGANWWQEEETFLIHLFYLTTSDIRDVRQEVDSLADIFRGQNFGGVYCQAPNPPIPGDERKGRWQALSVSVPYYYRLTA